MTDKERIMNLIAEFEIEVCVNKDWAFSEEDFKKYKEKYNKKLETTADKIMLIYERGCLSNKKDV